MYYQPSSTMTSYPNMYTQMNNNYNSNSMFPTTETSPVKKIFKILFKVIVFIGILYCLNKSYKSSPKFVEFYNIFKWKDAFVWILCATVIALVFLVYCWLSKGDNLITMAITKVFPKFIPVVGQFMLIMDLYSCVMD